MSTENPEARHYNPAKFRKRKKYQGASWTPQDRNAVLKEDGAYCHDCRKRHGWMNGLNISYEKRGESWFILWSCKKTGRMCEEWDLKKGRGNG